MISKKKVKNTKIMPIKSNGEVEKNDWTKTKLAWFLDKVVIAIIVVLSTAGVNYWTDIEKTTYASRVKTAENASTKIQELWESIGKYRASLEKIHRLKQERMIKLGLKTPITKSLNNEIEKEKKISLQLKDEVDQKINLFRSEVGKPVTEHAIQYTQLLTMYHQQLDSVSFDDWPKNFDLSPQFKSLENISEHLYQMEMNPQSIQMYVEQSFMK